MGEIMSEIWPYLLTAFVTSVGTYVGAIHKLRIKVAVLENRVEKMERDGAKVDEQLGKIQEDISDIKQSLARISAVLDADMRKGGRHERD